eukprot:Gb_21699 [translate_table: standard]
MSNETETVHGSQVLAQQRFNQAIELEKQLRSLIESKGPSGLTVRDLRCKIRESYESIILEDHEFAEGHDVEQALWRLHYKQIEEFRTRIRKSTAATAAAASTPTIPMPGAKNITRNEPIHKVLASFKSFLSEAKGFYHELILKLRAKHGIPQDFFSTEGVHCANDQKSAADWKRCQLSCHRCLIYLGDLARYKELHGDGDVQNHDWSVAAGYYLKAVSLWPASGNPHNQLAVLATYVGDELLAVYRYFRSLAVETPFVTARDNLILLFEKNRQHYTQLSSAANETNLQASNASESAKTKSDTTLLIGDGVKLAVKDHKQHNAGEYADSMSEIRKSFRVRFVRLNGILFTKTSLETFPEVYAATMHELEQLLSLDDMFLEAGLGSELRSGIGTGSSGAAGVVQLVCVLIFTVHNANGTNMVQQPTYAEVLQRSALLQNALTAAFECAGRLMRRCVDSNDVSTSPFVPAMLVFTEWLACRPEISVGTEVDEKQAHARSFFWRQCVTLLNKLHKSQAPDVSVGLGAVDSLGKLNEGGIALWEDYELQGFVPLVPAQMALDYMISPVRVGVRDRKEWQVRVQRLLAAGKAIGIAFSGTGKGIAYDEETARFCMAQELKERNKKEMTSADGQTVVKHVEYPQHVSAGFSDMSGVGFKESNQASVKDAFPESAHGDEDDEEYIVFKPVPKDMSAIHADHISASRESGEVPLDASNFVISDMSSASQNISRLDNLGISSIPVEQPLDSILQGQNQFSTCAFPDFLPGTRLQGDGMASEFNVHGSRALTGFPPMACSTLPTLVSIPNSMCVLSPGQISSLGQGELQVISSAMIMNKTSYSNDTLNSIGAPLSAFPSSSLTSWGIQNSDMMLIGGPVKTNSPGVIGQQKQADLSLSYWNTELQTHSLPRLSSLSINDQMSTQLAVESSGAASNFTTLSSQRDEMEHHIIPSSFLTDSPFWSSRPYPSAPLLPDENVDISRDVAASTRFLNQSVLDQAGIVNAPAKDAHPAFLMQPDYSYVRKGSLKPSISSGQLVTKENNGKSRMGPSALGPPPGFAPTLKSLQSDEDVEGPLQVDDYAWLDGYTSSSVPASINQQYKDWGLPMYSSDNGIWSSADKLVVSSDDTEFPFPGMGFSKFHHADDQQEKQRRDMQLSEQLLQDHQTKSFDYGMEAKPMQFGNFQSLYEAQHQSQSQQQLLLLQQKQQEWYRQYYTGGPFAS